MFSPHPPISLLSFGIDNACYLFWQYFFLTVNDNVQMDVIEDDRRVMGRVSQEEGSEVCLMARIELGNVQNPTTRRLFPISLCVFCVDNPSTSLYLIVCLFSMAIYIFHSQKRIYYKTRGRERNWNNISENVILKRHERYSVPKICCYTILSWMLYKSHMEGVLQFPAWQSESSARFCGH